MKQYVVDKGEMVKYLDDEGMPYTAYNYVIEMQDGDNTYRYGKYFKYAYDAYQVIYTFEDAPNKTINNWIKL